MKKLVISLLILLPFKAIADSSGTCGENLTWFYESATHTLKISGSGAMTNYTIVSQTNAPWSDFQGSITTIILNEGVTSIGNYAFYDTRKLTSITFPNSLKSIGEYSFYKCI